MSKHLQRELNNLKKKIFELCAMVEENLTNSIKSIIEGDEILSDKVVKYDKQIDCMEIEVEEECLKILALYQPVAIDLRFIVAALKINNDLERVGDLAVNIVERGFRIFKIKKGEYKLDFDFAEMCYKSMGMVKKSLDAFITFDAKLSYEVCAADDEVDALNRKMFDIFKEEVKRDPENIELMLQYLSISRHLERIGDHATNIAEDVIYLADGDIIRHKKPN